MMMGRLKTEVSAVYGWFFVLSREEAMPLVQVPCQSMADEEKWQLISLLKGVQHRIDNDQGYQGESGFMFSTFNISNVKQFMQWSKPKELHTYLNSN